MKAWHVVLYKDLMKQAAEKLSRSPSTSRTNGERFDMIKKIPLMLRFSKHSVSFFSNLVVYYYHCGMPLQRFRQLMNPQLHRDLF